ncbi:Hypothetical_protein [Hexamita inflata]|uniref:Hypothetical_protein n=1 Tax=Hexamita inflata TaxID=28002 RepID=A0AA86TZ89_9EUKA|nr:Hypothetical protein HINF_LOCUS10301 [Hexamita inflata]CAI9934061.1 Hypothetical protein HINF_LOCUS21706 [Hexamita inflata]
MMLLLSSSISVCYFSPEAELKENTFEIEFQSCKPFGTLLQITFTPQTPRALVFTKTIAVEKKFKAQVEFSCRDIIPYDQQCETDLKNLKTNITGQLLITENSVIETLNVFVEVEVQNQGLSGATIGIIAGCSAGGVVLIIIIIWVSCYCSKKNAAMKQPLLNVYQQQAPVKNFAAAPLPVGTQQAQW